MVANGSVATHERHVPDLPFAGVAKGAVVKPHIAIPVLFARIPGEEQDQGMAARGADAALALATKRLVEPSPAERWPGLQQVADIYVLCIHDTSVLLKCRFELAPGVFQF